MTLGTDSCIDSLKKKGKSIKPTHLQYGYISLPI